MKALITGAGGQLGQELARSVPADIELFTFDSRRLDITNQDNVARIVTDVCPNWIINTAAYTAVDKAESEPEKAFAVNAAGAGNVAEAASIVGARIIHISTDFVFDGKANTPYKESDTPNPMSVYGKSKLEGERRLFDQAGDKAIIIRSSWIYSQYGNNFVKTMLRLMKERDSLGVVIDQVGTPTWAGGLAKTIWKIVFNNDVAGLFHWSDLGVASWYDFAIAISEEASQVGLLKREIPIRPISAHEYPTPASRPKFSVLDKSLLASVIGGESTVHWRKNLKEMLEGLC